MKRALAVLAALACLGCVPNAVVGDSISVPIPSTSRYVVNASGGRTVYNPGHGPATSSGQDAVAQLAPKLPKGGWMIVELGTNDVTNPIGTLAGRVQAIVNRVPADKCLAFVTIWRTHPSYAARIVEWNRLVREKVRQRACRAIIEWNAAARAFPVLMSSDGIHPSSRGTRWLTDEYGRVAALKPGAYA